MTSSRQPPELDRYLARHGFAPHPGHSTWPGRESGQQIIRVLREPGEETLLICLTPRSVRLYEALFSPGTPDAVIIAAGASGAQPACAQDGRCRARAGPGPAHARREAEKRREAVTCDDDR